MQIDLFGAGQAGKSPVVTAQKRLGLYAELTPDGEKGRIAFYGTPGKTLDYSFGDTPIRGSLPFGDYTYHVHRGTFWQVNNAGVKTNRGSLNTTTGRVRMACNGTQIAIVDGTDMYCFTIATNAFAVVSSGLFDNPVDITYQDGYGIAMFRNTQIRQISGLADFTTWDALEFDSAESNPDNLVRNISDHGELVSCGELTTEFAANTGDQDYAFSALKSSTLEFGLAAPDSLVKYNDSLAGLFKNTMGQVQVMMMRGHALTPISNQELDHVINSYDTVNDATALSYMLGGHPMYQINFPSAGKSWLYDASTTLWTQLESGLSGGRDRAEIGYDYLNKPRVTDFENGNVYTISDEAYDDNGTPIPREIITRNFSQGGKKLTVSRLEIEFETGVGNTSAPNPQVMLQVSKDNGRTWGNELWRPLGKQGEYKSPRVYWSRLGSAYNWLFKIRITDAVKVVITRGFIEAEVGQ